MEILQLTEKDRQIALEKVLDRCLEGRNPLGWRAIQYDQNVFEAFLTETIRLEVSKVTICQGAPQQAEGYVLYVGETSSPFGSTSKEIGHITNGNDWRVQRVYDTARESVKSGAILLEQRAANAVEKLRKALATQKGGQ